MKNVALKIFSVIAAMLLAHFVNSEGNSSVIGFFAPVELKNLPKDKVLVWPLTPQAQVSVKGPSFLVSNVASSPPTFKVKIPNDVQDQYVATLKRSDLTLPPNVQVVSVDPGEIKFMFDSLVEKELPVELTNLGALRANLKVEEVVINPSRVLVRGPQSRIRDLVNIQTEPIDLREVSDSFSRDLALRPPAALIELTPGQVQLIYKVSSVRSQKKFTALPVEVRSSGAEKYTLSPTTVSVEVAGPLEKVAALKAEEVIPFVRVPPDVTGSTQLGVSTELPKEISIVQIDPAKLQVVKSAAGEGKRTSAKPKPSASK